MRVKSDRLHGFDLTLIDDGQAGVDKWKAILKVMKLPLKPYHDKANYCYVWANKRVKLVTANNPITGQYSHPSKRDPELGYASYIGIEGSPAQVAQLATLIREAAVSIKEEVPGERQFI